VRNTHHPDDGRPDAMARLRALEDDSIRLCAWIRASTRCECRNELCGHVGRCGATLRRDAFVFVPLSAHVTSLGMVMCPDCYDRMQCDVRER
jgi:hypothetical protein